MFTPIPTAIIEDVCEPFDGIQLSSKEIYAHLEIEIKKKDLPNRTLSRVSLSEGGVLSHNREYLRVARKEIAFDICVAPFGTHCFISYRLGEYEAMWRQYFSRIPILKLLVAKIPKQQTYFQADAERMFRYAVTQTLTETIAKIKLEKGIRGMVEIKRQQEIEN